MNKRTARGFTLLELLTVIAIIGILAAMIFAVGPRLITEAKLRSLRNTMNELRTALAQYYVTYGTYPPAYGYMDYDAFAKMQQTGVRPDDNVLFNLRPYLSFLKLHGAEDYYDNFSEGYDADADGQISLFEYQPVGVEDAASGKFSFPDVVRYDGTNPGMVSEISRMREERKRPILYIPVNKRQFERAKQYWIKRAAQTDPDDFYALSWDPTDPNLQGMVLPPATYDAFVLISVGPGKSTFGIPPPAAITDSAWDLATENITTSYPDDLYHIIGMRAYFLATRDLDGDDKLDFSYEDRKSAGSTGEPYQIVVNNQQVTVPLGNLMPDRKAPNGLGPFIYVYE